jgi:DNA repair protein SbcC/Rad50
MLPIKLRIKNIGPYVDETIDFQSIGGDVVAIVGENGAGKTMLMDSIFAALYRYFPSRDSIYKYCRGKDAGLEFEFSNGFIRYRTEIKINAKSREMESWIFQQNLIADTTGDQKFIALSDGKNSTFDKKMIEIVGPSEVALASVYAAQNKAGSFLSLPKAKRKELFIDLLGLGKLQVISDQASEREKKSSNLYNQVYAKVEALKSTSSLSINLEDMYKKLEVLRTEVELAETNVKLSTFESGILKAKAMAVKDIELRRAPIQKRKDQLVRDWSETTKGLSNAEAQSSKLETYRSQAALCDSISRDLDSARIEVGALSGEVSEYHKKVNQYNVTIGALKAHVAEHMKISLLSEKDLKRAQSDSAIINTVPCKAEGECANCEFLVNAIKQKEAVSDLEAKIDESKAAILNLEFQIKSESRPEGEQLAVAEARLKVLQVKIKELESAYTESNSARNKLVTAEAAASLVGDLKQRIVRLESEQAEVEVQVAGFVSELKDAQEASDKYKQSEKALELEQENLDGANMAHSKFLSEVSRAEVQLSQIEQAKKELQVITPELIKHDKDRKEWNLLSKAFSKTGIQSLEIDASGPAVSEITNDLLLGCFGPRFSVRFVTQVLKDDKSGYKDDFDIYVTDGLSDGRDGSIDDLSGGEKVIVCEAVSLAISLFNRSRASVGWLSLWRDEASSAVDDKRAPLYISMLRKARELGHFEKLYFIAHQQRVTENADSKLIVDSGHVTFE